MGQTSLSQQGVTENLRSKQSIVAAVSGGLLGDQVQLQVLGPQHALQRLHILYQFKDPKSAEEVYDSQIQY